MRTVRSWLLPLLAFLFCITDKSHAIQIPRPLAKHQDSEAEAGVLASSAAAVSSVGGSILSGSKTALSNQLVALFLAGIVGFGTDPLVEAIFNVTYLHEDNDDIRHTFLYGAADSLSNGARATGLVLVGSMLQQYLGIHMPFQVNLLDAAPKIGFVVWTTLTLGTTKRTLLQRYVQGIKGLGRVGLYDKMIDLLLGVGAVGNIMRILNIDIGMGFQSLFAASGVSALVFSLASRGLVEQIASGFILQAWDAIEEGESIRLGDGTEGTVVRVGLVETVLVGGDDVETRIPNTQISKQRISNLSHVTKSQFKQILRFKYSDLSKVPDVLDTIKQEIKANCWDLIVDGSKPFRAVLTQYEPDHVQAEITCNFNLKPGSAGFIEARQQVLLAIANAIAMHNVEFAIPSIRYHTTDEASSLPILGESNPTQRKPQAAT